MLQNPADPESKIRIQVNYSQKKTPKHCYSSHATPLLLIWQFPAAMPACGCMAMPAVRVSSWWLGVALQASGSKTCCHAQGASGHLQIRSNSKEGADWRTTSAGVSSAEVSCVLSLCCCLEGQLSMCWPRYRTKRHHNAAGGSCSKSLGRRCREGWALVWIQRCPAMTYDHSWRL